MTERYPKYFPVPLFIFPAFTTAGNMLGPRAGARNPVQVSHMGGKNLTGWIVTTASQNLC